LNKVALIKSGGSLQNGRMGGSHLLTLWVGGDLVTSP